jgi:hypothetical protein
VLALAVAGCANPTASPTPTPLPSGSEAASPSTSQVSASPEPTFEPTPVGVELPEPGRPFEGAGLLREMQSSTRPGGVPDAVQTRRLADAIAATLWTVDGSAWDTIAVGGYCGTTSCTVEIAGTRIGRAGEDLWVLEVEPETARVAVVAAELRSLPSDLVEELDELVRDSEAGRWLGDMMLTTARWMPPPTAERFVLSYRSGGEEDSCRRDVTVDAARAEVLETTASGC